MCLRRPLIRCNWISELCPLLAIIVTSSPPANGKLLLWQCLVKRFPAVKCGTCRHEDARTQQRRYGNTPFFCAIIQPEPGTLTHIGEKCSELSWVAHVPPCPQDASCHVQYALELLNDYRRKWESTANANKSLPLCPDCFDMDRASIAGLTSKAGSHNWHLSNGTPGIARSLILGDRCCVSWRDSSIPALCFPLPGRVCNVCNYDS